MNKRSKAPARVLAVLALIAAVIVLVVMVSAALNSEDSSDSGTGGSGGKSKHHAVAKNAPKVYVIKNGDTLTAIAHQTGVPVAKIERLNPQTDPLSLISGEKLKLR